MFYVKNNNARLRTSVRIITVPNAANAFIIRSKILLEAIIILPFVARNLMPSESNAHVWAKCNRIKREVIADIMKTAAISGSAGLRHRATRDTNAPVIKPFKANIISDIT